MKLYKKLLAVSIIVLLLVACGVLGKIFVFGNKCVCQQNVNSTAEPYSAEDAGKTGEVLFFVENSEDYSLLLENQLYSVNAEPESSKIIDNTDDLVLTPIIGVPENSRIFNVGRNNNNSNKIFFVVDVAVKFSHVVIADAGYKNSAGYQRDLLVIYEYDKKNKTVKPLITNLDFGTFGGYPVINQISDDGDYISFNIYNCWNCEAAHPQTYIYDISQRDGKTIGQVNNFEWLDNGRYRYRESSSLPYITKNFEN